MPKSHSKAVWPPSPEDPLVHVWLVGKVHNPRHCWRACRTVREPTQSREGICKFKHFQAFNVPHLFFWKWVFYIVSSRGSLQYPCYCEVCWVRPLACCSWGSSYLAWPNVDPQQPVELCCVYVWLGFGSGGRGYWCGSCEKLPQLQVQPVSGQGWTNQHLCVNIFKRGKSRWVSSFVLERCGSWERLPCGHQGQWGRREWGRQVSDSSLVCDEMAGWAPAALRDQQWSRIPSAACGGPHNGAGKQLLKKAMTLREEHALAVCHWEDCSHGRDPYWEGRHVAAGAGCGFSPKGGRSQRNNKEWTDNNSHSLPSPAIGWEEIQNQKQSWVWEKGRGGWRCF